MTPTRALALLLALVLVPAAAAQIPRTRHPVPLGLTQTSGAATSADGSKVLVQAWNGSGPVQACYRWTHDLGAEAVVPPPGWSRAAGEVMSRDGEVIAGRLSNSSVSNAAVFRWTQAGGSQEVLEITALGFTSVADLRISDDGSTLAGTGVEASGLRVPFLWSQQGGAVLPATLSPFLFRQTALSGDGEVLAGWYVTPGGPIGACRWSAAGGFIDLGTVVAGIQHTPSVISVDGTSIAGTARFPSGLSTGFLWTEAGGIRTLPSVAGRSWSQVRGMTPSGDTLIGAVSASAFTSERAVRLRLGSAPDDLGPMNPALFSTTSSISDDGTVVTGNEFFPFGFPVTSWVWSETTGFRQLEVVFGTGAFVSAVSADGRLAVGRDRAVFDVVGSETVALTWSLAAPDGPILPGTRVESGVVPNFTGVAARLRAQGAADVAANDVTLTATNVPAGVPCLFINSDVVAATPIFNVGGGQGTLLLGGQIGRFAGPGQVVTADSFGAAWLPIDLASIPTPSGPVALQSGDTRSFQLWHRDVAGGGATSNLSDAVEIVFQ